LSALVACLIACAVAVLRNGLNVVDVGWIWVWNIAIFIVVDAGKVCFRNFIGDAPGDTIDSDTLLPPPAPKTEDQLQQEKHERLAAHKQSSLAPSDTAHNVEVTDNSGSFTDGIIQNSRRLAALAQSGGLTGNTTKKGKNKDATFKAPETELA